MIIEKILKKVAREESSGFICGTVGDNRIRILIISLGSQCSNLFPAWKPENARAWVSHACGVFHEPTGRMRNVPGLVTCGDADTTRYILSRAFVENCRKKGINIIWKSFPNHPHDVPPDSLKLARAFLAYYHELYLSDLGGSSMRKIQQKVLFVGDDQEGKF